MAFGVKGVHFVEAGSQLVQFCDYESGKVTSVGNLPAGTILPRRTGFTVSPDGKVLVYSKPAQTISDLYLVEGVR